MTGPHGLRAMVVPAVRSGRLLAAPTTGNRSGCTRRGGYQPPEQARDSRRTTAESRRAACPHAAMTGPHGLRAMVVPAVRSGRLLAAPTTGNRSGCTRRGGYQPPEQARDSRRTTAEPRRAACPHAAMTGPHRLRAMVVPAVRSGRLLAARPGPQFPPHHRRAS